jgi:hypothetical protein
MPCFLVFGKYWELKGKSEKNKAKKKPYFSSERIHSPFRGCKIMLCKATSKYTTNFLIDLYNSMDGWMDE